MNFSNDPIGNHIRVPFWNEEFFYYAKYQTLLDISKYLYSPPHPRHTQENSDSFIA